LTCHSISSSLKFFQYFINNFFYSTILEFNKRREYSYYTIDINWHSHSYFLNGIVWKTVFSLYFDWNFNEKFTLFIFFSPRFCCCWRIKKFMFSKWGLNWEICS
jgi:hypothetical protein